MTEAVTQDRPRLTLYQPGDELRICHPGETVSLWEKAGSLLCFTIDDLDFNGVAKSLATRIKSALRNGNDVYLGDIVAKEDITKSIIHDGAGLWSLKPNGLGEKTTPVLVGELRKIGLNTGLKIEGWPPESIEQLTLSLPKPQRHGPGRMSRYLEGVIRPAI